jgi:hypothetical protein
MANPRGFRAFASRDEPRGRSTARPLASFLLSLFESARRARSSTASAPRN